MLPSNIIKSDPPPLFLGSSTLGSVMLNCEREEEEGGEIYKSMFGVDVIGKAQYVCLIDTGNIIVCVYSAIVWVTKRNEEI